MRHKYHKERLEHNEEIGNQLPCKKEELWKPVYEVWYSVTPKVLEELNNSMQENYKCCCVVIGMYLKYVVVFHWNIFDIYKQLLPDYTLIWFIETKWHKHLIIRAMKVKQNKTEITLMIHKRSTALERSVD